MRLSSKSDHLSNALLVWLLHARESPGRPSASRPRRVVRTSCNGKSCAFNRSIGIHSSQVNQSTTQGVMRLGVGGALLSRLTSLCCVQWKIWSSGRACVSSTVWAAQPAYHHCTGVIQKNQLYIVSLLGFLCHLGVFREAHAVQRAALGRGGAWTAAASATAESA